MSSSYARRARRVRASSGAPTAPGVPLLLRHHSASCKAPLLDCTCAPDLTLVLCASRSVVAAGMRMAAVRSDRIRSALD